MTQNKKNVDVKVVVINLGDFKQNVNTFFCSIVT